MVALEKNLSKQMTSKLAHFSIKTPKMLNMAVSFLERYSWGCMEKYVHTHIYNFVNRSKIWNKTNIILYFISLSRCLKLHFVV